MHQLAVIDGTAPKRRLRHVGLAAELRYLAEKLVVFHRAGDLGRGGGQRQLTRTSYHHLPNGGNADRPPGEARLRDLPATSTVSSRSATLANILKRISSPGGEDARTVWRD